MKKIDAFKAWVLRWYDYYDHRFDLPKELSIQSMVRFVISVKRQKRAEKKLAGREEVSATIEDAKISDQKIDTFIRKIGGEVKAVGIETGQN